MRKLAIAFIAFGMLTAAGCRWSTDPPKGKDAAAAPAPVPKVAATPPVQKSLRKVVDQPGSILPYEQTELFAKVGGYVSKLHADIGKKVRGPKYDPRGEETEPGEVLAEIEVPELEQERNQKVAIVAQTKAEADQARRALASAEANIGELEAKAMEAKAGIGRANALIERWESESKRTATLAKTGVLDAQAAEETRNQYRSAQASLEEVKARVTASEASVRKAMADRDRATADVKTAEARIRVAEADSGRVEALYRYRFVRAPFDGVVTRRRVDTGHYLAAGQGKGEGLFVVARLDPVRLVFTVPEASAGWVANGSKVDISVQAARGLHLSGKVDRTSWSLDPGSRTLRAEIDMPNAEDQLRPGMYLYAHIAADLPKGWTLPTAAIAKQGEEYVCFLIDGDKVRRTIIEIGHTDQGFVECPRRRETTGAFVEWTGNERVAGKAAGLTDGQTVQVEP